MKNSMMFGCSHGSASRREILYRPQGGGDRRAAFTLVEVVIALGIITVGIVAVLGVFPAALQTGHSAQDETRAAHIAQSVFGSLAATASTHFSNAQLPLYPSPSPAPSPLSIDLTTNSGTTPAVTCYADNDGKLTNSATNTTYAIQIYTSTSVPGFTDPASANQVTVRVLWPLIPGQGPTPAPNQTFRDYVRNISKY